MATEETYTTVQIPNGGRSWLVLSTTIEPSTDNSFDEWTVHESFDDALAMYQGLLPIRDIVSISVPIESSDYECVVIPDWEPVVKETATDFIKVLVEGNKQLNRLDKYLSVNHVESCNKGSNWTECNEECSEKFNKESLHHSLYVELVMPLQGIERIANGSAEEIDVKPFDHLGYLKESIEGVKEFLKDKEN